MIEPSDIRARARFIDGVTKQVTPFGEASPFTGATSQSRVLLSPGNERAMEALRATGKVHPITAPTSFSPQEAQPSLKVFRLLNTSTKEVRDVPREQAYALQRQGWMTMAVVNAQPTPQKKAGKL